MLLVGGIEVVAILRECVNFRLLHVPYGIFFTKFGELFTIFRMSYNRFFPNFASSRDLDLWPVVLRLAPPVTCNEETFADFELCIDFPF